MPFTTPTHRTLASIHRMKDDIMPLWHSRMPQPDDGTSEPGAKLTLSVFMPLLKGIIVPIDYNDGNGIENTSGGLNWRSWVITGVREDLFVFNADFLTPEDSF